MKHGVALGTVLALVWLGWSGHTDPLLLGLGAASCLTVLVLVRRAGLLDGEAAPLGLSLRALAYAPWLLWQIALANLSVAGRILRGRPVTPRVITVAATQRSGLCRVVFANSITLTPGTVSLRVGPDRIVVHALTEGAARDLASGEMNRRVTAIEGRN